ncbi:MAG: insulinase family protein, partial [Eggerthellaceae bacterium]|nr:insulinase family protein [Eggerthellaceae bacterium]
VFHILEHSVLCGSQKYPVKEPFVNLLKTSMQTFLNAMTFPDKTMYPVASTNEKDLMNLISVYMDAVLYPNIYTQKNIFEQEGWHYELTSVNSGEAEKEAQEVLRYNGVVFNEMKGALSSSESVLYHEMNKALFPDTCYAFESGGHPRNIPQLTYENFLDHHARHYRLDNSYIILYGNLDAQNLLDFLDTEYLSKAQLRSTSPINNIGTQKAHVSPDVSVPMNTAEHNACVGAGYVIGNSTDVKRIMATEILLDAVLGGNESPIKRALLDAQLGGAVSSFVMDSQSQPAVLVMLRNAKQDVASKLRDIVYAQAEMLAQKGIPRDILQASFAQAAFALRERDRGMADGVALAMNVMAGWLYNEEDALAYLRFEDILTELKQNIDTDYFENLLLEIFVTNNHRALVSIEPQIQESPSLEEEELQRILETLSADEKQAIKTNQELLRTLQETPDSPEAVAMLPRLHVSDIGGCTSDPEASIYEQSKISCLHHNLEARGINYVQHFFDIEHIAWEDMPYVNILRLCLGSLGTHDMSASEVDVLINTHLGGLGCALRTFGDFNDREKSRHMFVLSASAIQENLEHLATIPAYIWSQTAFSDKGKIKDILLQVKVSMAHSFASSGHAHAKAAIFAQLDKDAALASWQSGLDFYLFLVDLLENFDERFDNVRKKLEILQSRIFGKANATISFVGSETDIASYWSYAGDLSLSDEIFDACLSIPDADVQDKAYVVPSDVVYVAKGAFVNPAHEKLNFSGTASVLNSAMTLDYLWDEVRVKGGAYGTGFSRGVSGAAIFHSYRDPHIDETLRRFDGASVWLEQKEFSEDEIEGYIVSAVAKMDAPAKPKTLAARATRRFFTNTPATHAEEVRAEALTTSSHALRAYAQELALVAERGPVCVFGNKDIIEASTHAFEVIQLP